MKIVLNHTVADISNILKDLIPVYLNRNGNITECNGMFYNQTSIKLVPSNRSDSIQILPEDEIYYNT